jgi:hypothetical protein
MLRLAVDVDVVAARRGVLKYLPARANSNKPNQNDLNSK